MSEPKPRPEHLLQFGVISSGGRLQSAHADRDEARVAAHQLAEERGGEWHVVEVVGTMRAVSQWEPVVNAAAVYP